MQLRDPPSLTAAKFTYGAIIDLTFAKTDGTLESNGPHQPLAVRLLHEFRTLTIALILRDTEFNENRRTHDVGVAKIHNSAQTVKKVRTIEVARDVWLDLNEKVSHSLGILIRLGPKLKDVAEQSLALIDLATIL
jgi:hypothetical protein